MNDVTVIVRPTAAPVINVVQATPPVITVNPMGLQGLQGLPGEVGDGLTIEEVNNLIDDALADLVSGYEHVQSVPSAVWTVNHNLGYKPAGVLVIDSSDRQVIGEVAYTNNNTLTITFIGGFSGTAYVS